MLFAKHMKVILANSACVATWGAEKQVSDPQGRFPSSFASKGRGLPVGLQSSSKAALHEYFRDGISSYSWVRSVSSCIPTRISAPAAPAPGRGRAGERRADAGQRTMVAPRTGGDGYGGGRGKAGGLGGFQLHRLRRRRRRGRAGGRAVARPLRMEH